MRQCLNADLVLALLPDLDIKPVNNGVLLLKRYTTQIYHEIFDIVYVELADRVNALHQDFETLVEGQKAQIKIRISIW